MTSDDRDRRGRPEDEPTVIGSGLHDVERSLRAGLEREAASIRPRERLDAILAQAHGGDLRPADSLASRWQRWLLPVAVAALVALVAVGIWVVRQPVPTPPPAASTTSSAAPTPTSGTATTTQGTPTTGSTPVPAPGHTSPVPVYYVGPRTDGSTTLVLFREFTKAEIAQPGDAAATATAALEQAVADGPVGAPYRPMWQGVRVDKVTVTSGEIDVTLSTGAKGLDQAEGQVAVQQLVWTAQAAVNKGNLPVRFSLADGSTTIAGDLTTGQTYVRPTGDAANRLLSPVWISEPSRGQALKAGKVTVSGVASTFEASVQWEIGRLGTPDKAVASGHTTASAGAPARGEYSFVVGPLPVGDYVVTVFETSPKDGSMSAVATMPFTLE